MRQAGSAKLNPCTKVINLGGRTVVPGLIDNHNHIVLLGMRPGHDIRIVPTVVNGSIGALLYMDGEIDHTLSMAIDGEKIAAIYLVRNPDKLRHVSVASQKAPNGPLT